MESGRRIGHAGNERRAMSVTLEYALGITGGTITGIAYASANGDASGVALTFIENTNRHGYYTVTSSGLTAGENWIVIAGDVIDSLFATIPTSGTIKILPGQNIVQVGGQTANAAAAVTFPATVASTTNITGGIITTVTNLTNAPTSGDLTSTMKASVTAAAPTAAGIAAATRDVNNTSPAANSLGAAVNAARGGTVVVDNFITVPAAIAVASQTPGQIVVIRGDTLSRSLPLMGSISARTKLTFTAKLQCQTETTTNTDSSSILQITEAGGLIVLNGVSTGLTSSNASLTVTNATTGATTLVIAGVVTAQLALQDSEWDLQAILPTGPWTPVAGNLSVSADVTQSTN